MTLFQALKVLMRLNRHYVNDWYKRMYRFHKAEFADIMLAHCKMHPIVRSDSDLELYLSKWTVAQHIIKGDDFKPKADGYGADSYCHWTPIKEGK